MSGRDYGVCVFLGDEGKFGLATRPAKLYSTSSALLRLWDVLEQVFGPRANLNVEKLPSDRDSLYNKRDVHGRVYQAISFAQHRFKCVSHGLG